MVSRKLYSFANSTFKVCARPYSSPSTICLDNTSRFSVDPKCLLDWTHKNDFDFEPQFLFGQAKFCLVPNNLGDKNVLVMDQICFRLGFFGPKCLLFGNLEENSSVALPSPACLTEYDMNIFDQKL